MKNKNENDNFINKLTDNIFFGICLFILIIRLICSLCLGSYTNYSINILLSILLIMIYYIKNDIKYDDYKDLLEEPNKTK